MHANTSWLVVAVFTGIAAFGAAARAQQLPTMDEIVAKWEERQKKVSSARVRWDEEQTRAKGMVSKLELPLRGRGKQAADCPPEDYTFTKPCLVSIDRDKLRYEYEEVNWLSTK